MIILSILLDAGLFMTDEEADGYQFSEVGYFAPRVHIYQDGERIAELSQNLFGSDGQTIKVRKMTAAGVEINEGIRLSSSLIRDLLRLHKVYDESIIPVDRASLDCIFHFTSGIFRASSVKPRYFQQVDGKSHLPIPNSRKFVGLIAHDIVVEYAIDDGEILSMTDAAGGVIYRSGGARLRIDIEILADNSAAEMLYREALKLRGQNYWLPNQDDPPPIWTHGRRPTGRY